MEKPSAAEAADPAGIRDSAAQPQQQGTTQTYPPRVAPSTQTKRAVRPTFFGELAGTDGAEPYASLRRRVTKSYQAHTYQYWFVAILSNSLLFLQILVAASLTALGALHSRRASTAIIFLGATNTVIAGLLTYFKSRNQPNRARQFRNDLATIVDQLDDTEANFQNPDYDGNVFTEMEKIRAAYKQARIDAQANYPDLWVKGTSPYNPNWTPPNVTDPKTTAGSTLPNRIFRGRAQSWSAPGPSDRTAKEPSR
ncbi:hypothetical protein H2200_005601 [Cladophialophora chaetospira]|uniref:SMODS and SLOG-associating 2TM effector domain-containing protein n=1 Tax=Cladophialophora chaetospira TaxID=386627 RepID=A0AA38XCD2_9EURO|nr:hypothetical protein H2200_005601 [Cladophialophora chaetospira]